MGERRDELMFLGEFKHSIDNKGRLIIPAKFRDLLDGKCVIAKGLDGCLSVYPIEEWEQICAKIDEKPASDPKVRKFKRLFFASASAEECDKQGRLSIPNGLLQYAQIDKDVYVIGESNVIEIWSEERWLAQQHTDENESFEELAQFLNI